MFLVWILIECEEYISKQTNHFPVYDKSVYTLDTCLLLTVIVPMFYLLRSHFLVNVFLLYWHNQASVTVLNKKYRIIEGIKFRFVIHWTKNSSLKMGVPAQRYQGSKLLDFSLQEQDSCSTQSTGQSYTSTGSFGENDLNTRSMCFAQSGNKDWCINALLYLV